MKIFINDHKYSTKSMARINKHKRLLFMKYRSYNSELKTALAMFMDVFNDIVIDRRDDQNNIQQTINVPCLYGSRSRLLKSLSNPGNNIQLPLIVVTQNGLARDDDRVHSVNQYKLLTPDGGNVYQNYTAVPIVINYTVSILTKLQEDADQIVGNFAPFFNPDVYVVHSAPHQGGNLKSQIIFDGNFGYTYPDDATDTDPARITVDCTFSYKTWLFPGLDTTAPTADKLIYKINLHGDQSDPINEVTVGDLSKWYDIKVQTIDSYIDKVKAGYIKYPNYDSMQWPHKYAKADLAYTLDENGNTHVPELADWIDQQLGLGGP